MKRNLTTRMIVSFLLVVATAMGGFAVSIIKIVQIEKSMEVMKNEGLANLEVVNVLAYNSLDKISLIRGYFLTGEEILLEVYANEKNQNLANEEKLFQTSKSKDEQELAKRLKEADARYTDIADKKVIPMIKNGKKEEALAVMKGELAAATNELIPLADQYKEISLKNIEDTFERNIVNARNAILMSLFTAIIACSMGLLIGYNSAKRIAKPINKISATAEKVAAGNLTLSVEVNCEDEVGRLAGSFNMMIHQLRDLIKRIDDHAAHVAAASEELTAGATQSSNAVDQVTKTISASAKGAAEQLKATGRAAATVEEISSNIEHIAAYVQEIAENSSQTAEKAKEGGNILNRATNQMDKIEKTVDASAEVVSRLGQRSQEIGQIIETISGIAGQTNLLALNAAIEAARAGEQGLGFAVVAEEVRKLAEQSQEATKKISQLVEEIQSGTDQAVMAMTDGTREVKAGASVVNQAGSAFREIVTMVKQVCEQINEVSNAVREVAHGSADIVSSVKIIDQLSRRTSQEAENVSAVTGEQSSSVKKIAFSSQSLANLSEDLRNCISKFKI